jgi:DNA-binding transcriptional regulator LsrR (DeoR family)
VESYEQLEVLLLLVNSRELLWSCEAICQKLQLSEPVVAEALDALRRRRLVTTVEHEITGSFYAPEDAALNKAVMELSRAYDCQRLEIMKAMTANAIQRLRATAADAFETLASRKKSAH